MTALPCLDANSDSGSEMKTPSLEALPVDDVIFKSIFSKLDLKALSNLANTCTAYRNMVHKYFQTLKVIDIGNHGSKISERALNVLLGENYCCQKVLLRNCRSSLIDQIFQPFLERNPHLSHVNLTNCTSLSNSSLHILTVNCMQLVRLSLSGCVWTTPEAVTNLGIHCNSIEVFDLSGCWNINDDCISTISSTCPRLTDLNISRIYGISDKSIKSIARNSSCIRRLNVSECWRITDEGLWMLLEYSKHLKMLQVKGCRSVSVGLLASFKTKGVFTDSLILKPSNHLRNAPPVQI
ncbi:F-box/LRR-repeat protein 15-like [Watersipora subatra]|uniref:F-box/LRR-repeat protein 15-like n=1 Tax=Watersipora subatra TaxID=2589382 RepID=UPI00355B413F